MAILYIMDEPKQENDLLMRTSGAARELGLSSQRVLQLADAGTLPCTKTADGTRLFRQCDVRRLKKEREARAS